MGKLQRVALAGSASHSPANELTSDLLVKSLLTDAQNEELRLILSQPMEIATDEEMEEVFENWGD